MSAVPSYAPTDNLWLVVLRSNGRLAFQVWTVNPEQRNLENPSGEIVEHCRLAPEEAKLELDQLAVVHWVRSRFGDECMTDRQERAARLFEEATELLQAEGVSSDVAFRMIGHVYSRPPGDPKQEMAGIGVCLLACAAAAGSRLTDLVRGEIARIYGKSREHFRARHQAKADAGIALPVSPSGKVEP